MVLFVKLHLYQKNFGLGMYTSQCLSKDMLFSLSVLSETGLPACDSYKILKQYTELYTPPAVRF